MSAPFTPRLSQSRLLAYSGGRLGISAVPGSGKTQILSTLAAQIISSGRLEDDQEVLIVTLVNSAVDNFTSRIADLIHDSQPIARLGYRVRTLHGLAHDIVREDPSLVGLDPDFTIMDENAALSMVRDCAHAWAREHPVLFEAYGSPSLEENQRHRVSYRDWPDYLETVAVSFIRSAKDHHLAPEELGAAMEASRVPLPLAEMGLEIYRAYQRLLAARGAVDFDDLIRMAFRLLELSPELQSRLHQRWPYILEDEAQDSSRLQQEILSRVVGPHGNWVRVGDPNQAIFETFTTAEPQLLLDFIARHPHIDMPESGRAQKSLIDLANYLIDWDRAQHPLPEARGALNPPYIIPAPEGDPQPNPADDPSGLRLVGHGYSAEQEVAAVVESIEAWLPAHQDSTVAVLSSTNDHAAQIADALRYRGIEYRELLRATTPTRAAAGALASVLDYLASPDSGPKLSQAYRVWRRPWRDDLARRPLYDYAAGLLRRLRKVEEYIAPLVPAASADSLADTFASEDEAADVVAELIGFRDVVQRWQAAAALPVDQLVLTLSQEIFTEPTDLALGHKVALVLRQTSEQNPDWQLPDLIPTLHEIAHNERRFIGFSADDAGFNPDDYRGIVVISTVHKAKGLEWDRVYLLSNNSYDFPSDQNDDRFLSEKWFVRDNLNLEAEALAQLEFATSSTGLPLYREGPATRQARIDYIRERLRLLYVGITRARKELILTWNRGRRGEATASVPFTALQQWWKSQPPPEDRKHDS